MRQLKFVLCFALAFCLASSVQAQGLLKKLTQKAEQAADKAVDKKTDEAIGNKNEGQTASIPSTTGKNNPASKGGTNDRVDYELQLPLNSSLISLKAPGHSQDQVFKMENTIPVADKAKMRQ